MSVLRRVTGATVDVLRVLLSANAPVWGLRVVKATGLKAGSVYPILSRLEDGDWIVGEWESDEERPGPRRRLYRLTAEGQVEAQKVVATFDEGVSQTAARAVRPRPQEGFA